MCKAILTVMIVILLAAVSADAFVEVRPDRLEVDGKMLGKAVNAREMDEMRGGYMGFSFSVLFQGWWDRLGNANALFQSGGSVAGNSGANTASIAPPSNTTSGGDTSSPATATTPTNPAINIQAVVGNMGSAKGIFNITQVPGSNNLVINNMSVNIQIIQVLGNSIANLPSMPWH